MQRFYLSSRFRKVGSEDFRLAMEAGTGKDLQRFFERWIYGASLPNIAFTYRVESGATGPVAMLRFEQTGDLFDLPALVTLTYADGRTTDVTVRDHRQGHGGGGPARRHPASREHQQERCLTRRIPLTLTI